MSHVNGIICIYKKGNAVLHLFLVCIIEFVESIHLGNIASLNTNLYTLVHTICKNKFKRTAHIKERCIMPAVCLTGFLRFNTSDDVVFSCIFQSEASVLQCRNDNFIIIVSRKSDTGSCKVSCLHQQFMRRTIPYTDRQRRLRQEYLLGRLDAHK